MKGFILVVAVWLGATASIAAATSPEQRRQFVKLDANGDGRLSREEVAADTDIAKRFERLDDNKDGFLSQDELASKRRSLCG